MPAALPWYRSIAVKSCLVAFVATHIPLLGLIGVIVLHPDWLSPWGVFLAALGFTLAATALVVAVLWRMFRPLRAAADGLQAYMTDGRLPTPGAPAGDEVGRLVRVLVQSLAHVERGRSALLQAGARTIQEVDERAGHALPGQGWMVLLEVDQWEALDREGPVQDLVRVQAGLLAAVDAVLGAGEMLLPWGRGRVLAVLTGPGYEVVQRLEPLCAALALPGGAYTATAAVVPRERGPRSWAGGLQRLEQKLFALRLGGAAATVA